ncbi:ABC transporter substrate-binding protein [Cryptosporangium arvum]|jgi:multiple sugar transport system substrate-binding protein|uniref:Carbohydrate ABC transporter substrate-binding protein, CUT1 family n=1 Tax=Cryptosporangium arvum DSM 44712 TaxID=927661 RepID=A0A010Z6N5_9ACTN|nr:sugar ABC transporter substrate-binding protein [Cryptosporangium arvum]EXG82973.1 carbohydrate ABC transporter substrate-binding protein, CUT1 family [Cryptosporangium arvum DSM 44712]
MRRSFPRRAGRWRAPTLAAVLSLSVLATAACGGGGNAPSDKDTDVTITVALAADPPPKAALDEFKQETGITVNWVNIDWDSLQTKISAAATAKTYFADATNVDWSRVGELGKLGWYYPMDDYVDVNAMKADVPQLASFTYDGKVVGVPYDASFMVTTVNTELFKKAGADPAPKTMDEYTAALRKIKSSGTVKYPLNIPFAAAEGLSTYWYETTNAFGGTILDGKGKPQFSDPGSPGYKAAQWMVDALKSGLVPPGNINVTDSQGEQTLMARGSVASIFSDYSGLVGTLYNVPDSSSVVNKVAYLPTPGVTGPAANLSNPDGVGIMKTAKYPKAAAKFIDWFTQSDRQAEFAGLNGPEKAWASYALPSHLSAVEKLASDGKLIGGTELAALLKTSKPVFPEGAPAWYSKFSNAVYTHLHAAAAGSESVEQAVKAMSDTANDLSNGS